MTHSIAAVAVSVGVGAVLWLAVIVDYLATRNGLDMAVMPNATLTAMWNAPDFYPNESPEDRSKVARTIYWLWGPPIAIGAGIVMFAVCYGERGNKIRSAVQHTGHALTGLAFFIIAGIAAVAYSLTALENAKQRFVTLTCATISGLFASSVVALGQKGEDGRPSPVAHTLQSISLGFVGLLFWSFGMESPEASLAHKTVSILFIIGNSLALHVCHDHLFGLENVRYAAFCFAGILLSAIGGVDLQSSPISDMAWQRTWDSSHDVYGPMYIIFWFTSILAAVVGLWTWLHKACSACGMCKCAKGWCCNASAKRTGSSTTTATAAVSAASKTSHVGEEDEKFAVMSTGFVGFAAILGALFMFAATYARMSVTYAPRVQVLTDSIEAGYGDSDSRLSYYEMVIHFLPFIPLAVTWGLGIFAVCPKPNHRWHYEAVVHSLEAFVGIVIVGIATTSFTLTYLSGAKARLIPLQWATIAGLIGSSTIASNLPIKAGDASGRKSPVGLMIRNMQLNFCALIFWNLTPTLPYFSLGYKVAAVLLIIAGSLPDRGNTSFWARNIRHLILFTIAFIMCSMGSMMSNSSNPLVPLTWRASWDTANNAEWPPLLLFWASSLFVAAVLLVMWSMSAYEWWTGRGNGKKSVEIGLLSKTARNRLG